LEGLKRQNLTYNEGNHKQADLTPNEIHS